MISKTWFMERRIKLQHLRMLAAIGRYPTLHRAAADIGISQPAASKLVSEIEASVQHGLFDRTGRTLTPNALGVVLIRRAGLMLRELEQASDDMDALVHGRRGRVLVGAIDGPAVSHVARALVVMRRDYPLVDIGIETDSSVRLARMLRRGDIDIMLGRPTADLDAREFRYRALGHERLAIVARCDHPLTRGPACAVATLREQSWIVQSCGSTLRRWFDTVFAERDMPPPAHVVSTNSLLMTLAYLERSDALSVLSAPVARLQTRAGQLARVPVALALDTTPYGVISSLERTMAPALATFLSVLEGIPHPDRDDAWPDADPDIAPQTALVASGG